LFVAPSLYESFGIVYLEAMNYAKPVIGCRAGGIPEVVEEGVTGWLVEPDNSSELAEALVSALGAPKQLAERGMAGRERLLNRFTHIQMARETAKVYARVARHEAMQVTTRAGGVNGATSDER
jgi:glycosyltransferase involved in cell wall biosynthesis